MMWTTMQNSEAVRKPSLPFLSDWADKYIIRRKTNQFTISDLNGMSTHSFAWKGSKLLKVSNSELSQQENRGGNFLTFQFFHKAFERFLLFCYPICSYRNNKQLNKSKENFFLTRYSTNLTLLLVNILLIYVSGHSEVGNLAYFLLPNQNIASSKVSMNYLEQTINYINHYSKQ